MLILLNCVGLVLFNLYGPRAESDDADRIQFKFNFLKILQVRKFVSVRKFHL